MPAAAFVIAVILFFDLLAQPDSGRTVNQHLYDWIVVGSFQSRWRSSSTSCR